MLWKDLNLFQISKVQIHVVLKGFCVVFSWIVYHVHIFIPDLAMETDRLFKPLIDWVIDDWCSSLHSYTDFFSFKELWAVWRIMGLKC